LTEETSVPSEPAAPRAGDWPPWERWAFAAVALVVVFFYFYRLGKVPQGLYHDETSLGFNARAISRTLADQYGNKLPLFFRALDDYKSPLYVYAAAITEGILGPSPLSERLPATLYALGMAVGMYTLLRSLTGRERLARWMAVLSLLVPSMFTYGRHGVSEVSSMPCWLLIGLNALLAFQDSPTWKRAVWAGASLGLCTYSYSTARLLAPLMVATAAVCFFPDKRARRQLFAFLVAAAVIGIPMAVYMKTNPSKLDGRFNSLSIFRDHPTHWVALQRFVQQYARHIFSLDFLFRTGDPNRRHNIGIGELPLWLAVPMGLGLLSLWKRRSEPFIRFLMVLWVLAPVPVALILVEWPHASRTLHFAPLAIITAGIFFADVLTWARPSRAILIAATVGALAEGALFVTSYFVDYAPSSVDAFDGGRGEALQLAFAARQHDEPLYVPGDMFAYGGIHLGFYGDLDPVRLRAAGPGAFGISPSGAPSYPPGSIVVLPGAQRPPGQSEPIAVAHALDGRTLYSLFRMR
jgi:4-amino-4-deoxy-L-arabinose transferase-like glycosyltransferase